MTGSNLKPPFSPSSNPSASFSAQRNAESPHSKYQVLAPYTQTSGYEDAQIGAAVRNIQETCQKSLNDYLDLKAVIDQEEGEAVTIQAGFDANAIKLTGNVTGEPPFKGILQHRGWQISNFSLPALSGTQNPNIIAPAEVEIS